MIHLYKLCITDSVKVLKSQKLRCSYYIWFGHRPRSHQLDDPHRSIFHTTDLKGHTLVGFLQKKYTTSDNPNPRIGSFNVEWHYIWQGGYAYKKYRVRSMIWITRNMGCTCTKLKIFWWSLSGERSNNSNFSFNARGQSPKPTTTILGRKGKHSPTNS